MKKIILVIVMVGCMVTQADTVVVRQPGAIESIIRGVGTLVVGTLYFGKGVLMGATNTYPVQSVAVATPDGGAVAVATAPALSITAAPAGYTTVIVTQPPPRPRRVVPKVVFVHPPDAYIPAHETYYPPTQVVYRY